MSSPFTKLKSTLAIILLFAALISVIQNNNALDGITKPKWYAYCHFDGDALIEVLSCGKCHLEEYSSSFDDKLEFEEVDGSGASGNGGGVLALGPDSTVLNGSSSSYGRHNYFFYFKSAATTSSDYPDLNYNTDEQEVFSTKTTTNQPG
jgi:hypothetical protein